jgi:gentisate 1,2-dioxygenase
MGAQEPVVKLDNVDQYNTAVKPLNLIPAWLVMPIYAPELPKSKCLPTVWHYREIRPYLMEGSKLITAKQAERRALLLHNPGLGEDAHGITQTVSGDYQIILPGEVAPAHRHTQTAFRFFLEGEGAYTAIEGEKIYMKRGDFVIQPPHLWHHHGHDGKPGSAPAIWFDALDVGLVQALEATFFHSYTEDKFPGSRPAGDHHTRFGANVVPVRHQGNALDYRMFSYPYAQVRESLEGLRAADPADPHDGWKVRYTNPQTGGHCMPSMGAFMQVLPRGMTTAPYRSTDSTVFVCLEGSGRTVIGNKVLEWEPNDVFVLPSWQFYQHEADAEVVLFSYSDRAVQEKLGLWFEERGKSK